MVISMAAMEAHETNDGFMSMKEMKEKICNRMAQDKRDSTAEEKKRFPNWDNTLKTIKNWIYDDEINIQNDPRFRLLMPHQERIGGLVDCNKLTDEWWRWIITTPIGNSPVYGLVQSAPFVPTLFKTVDGDRSARAYMVGISAFKKNPPDVKRIVLTEAIPTLIPVYNMAAGAEEYLFDEKRARVTVSEEQLGEELTKIVLDDICSLRDFEAVLDGHDIAGCTVVRKQPYVIENIPSDNVMKVPDNRLGNKNSMRVCHGGFYLEFKEMKAGDHLLYLRAKSRFYEIEAEVHVSALTAITG